MTHNLIFAALLALTALVSPINKLPAQTPVSVINNPDLSYHCKQLLKELDQKHQDLLKAKALIVRNIKLQKDLPKRKEMAQARMTTNLSRLKHETELSELQYQRMKEGAIRKGCPGVIL